MTTGTAVQKRTKWSLNPFDWGSRSAPAKKTPGASSLDLDDPKTRQQFLERNREGKLEDNIFQDEIDSAKGGAATKGKGAAKGGSDVAETKTRENTAMVLDPSPKARVRWHRRKVMEMVRRNGAVTREERIRMTERELTHASPAMATSVKKLILLARQISGKTVDDAIQQMTWSKKKMAAEVKYHLEEARDLAVAQRGMGLGRVNGELFANPRKIKTREGKWLEVVDPSRMYIAQSWVGKGRIRASKPDFKGRGRMGIINRPSTCMLIPNSPALRSPHVKSFRVEC